jgi:hypothetical protein
MKSIKDLTKEQGLEITNLIYPTPELISDYEFTYQPYDEKMYEDAAELIRLRFKAPIFGDSPKYQLMVIICKSLDVYFYYWNEKININDYLPTRNQYKIQEKFKEWNIIPIF